MLTKCLILVFLGLYVNGAVLNATCPAISPRKLDLKALDGVWFLSSAASDLPLQGDCGMVVFQHTSDNSSSLSISWVNNQTASYHNGSAVVGAAGNATGDTLVVTYEDQTLETYVFLDVEYETYAFVFACNNTAGNSSTYELWKLNRKAHPKGEEDTKFTEALAKYSLQGAELVVFNNTEECCQRSSADLNPASLLLTSAAAVTLFRRLY